MAIWRLRLGLMAVPLITVLLGGFLATTLLAMLHRPLLINEMHLAAAVNLLAGLLAAVPFCVLLGRGAQALLRCALLATLSRTLLTAVGMAFVIIVAGGEIDRVGFLMWAASFYFMLAFGEHYGAAWALRRIRVEQLNLREC
ncbi:MAG: hypothetical protein HKL96_04395 [Phycisphaerales bacterium]|nr:hypothetical protein [Phycisphaerales bacterium]